MDALIMAGGQGTRLQPLTFSLPKPLMPVGSRPIIEIILNQLRRAGFEPNGEPRRKPKHFEIDAAKGGRLFEMHVTFAGEVRHAKPLLGTD